MSEVFSGMWNKALELLDGRLRLSPRVLRESTWSLILRLANIGLSFLVTLILARVLGAEGYGVYSYAYAIAWLFAIPAQAGLPNIVLRETARGIAQGRPDIVKGVWRWSSSLVGVISLAFVFLIGPSLVIWRGGLTSNQGLTIAWALALVPIIAVGNLRGAALRGLQYVVAGQLPEFLIRPGLLLLFLVGMPVLLGWASNAPAAMALHLVAALMSFIIGTWMLWRKAPVAVREAHPTSEARSWLGSTLLFALITGFHMINNQAGIVILGFFYQIEQVGIYRIAVQVAGLASFGLQAVNLVVAPQFADLYSEMKLDRLQRLVTGSARMVLAMNLLLTVVFLVFGKLLLTLAFGPEFSASYAPMVILLIGQMANSIVGSVAFLLNMTGHERDTARGLAAAAIINLLLNVLLVPPWGIKGTAVANAISLILWNVLLWWSVRRRLGINSLAFRVPEVREV